MALCLFSVYCAKDPKIENIYALLEYMVEQCTHALLLVNPALNFIAEVQDRDRESEQSRSEIEKIHAKLDDLAETVIEENDITAAEDAVIFLSQWQQKLRGVYQANGNSTNLPNLS